MNQILSNYTASTTELKTSLNSILKQSEGDTVAILNHNTVSSYLVSPNIYEKLLNIADDYLLSKEINKRLSQNVEPITVSLDEL